MNRNSEFSIVSTGKRIARLQFPHPSFFACALALVFAFAGLVSPVPSSAAMHFVQADGLFNFSLKSAGWFDNPINDQLFFNLTPAMSLIIENDSQNVLLSVSPLDAAMYGDHIGRAYEVMIEKITLDKANVIFLKNEYSHNGIEFRDIIYKDKNDLSNVRVILAQDVKQTSAREGRVFAAIFYFPKRSDFVNSEADVNFFIKTFMFKTELAEPLDDNLVSLGKGADCIGEYLSLYETTAGIVGVSGAKSRSPLFKSPLVKFNQGLETNDGAVSFKLNDGTLGFVNGKSRLDFLNMASVKLDSGEMVLKTEQRSSSTTIYCGNFVKLSVRSGVFSIARSASGESNQSVIRLGAAEGSAEVSFESNIAPARALGAGTSLEIIISDAGKLVSVSQGAQEPVTIGKDSKGWIGKLITHKVVEAVEYMEKLKSFDR